MVIGVDENETGGAQLPTVSLDVQALYDVLVHPERCAYRPENVQLLKGKESTAANILGKLGWLKKQVDADSNATAVIYYSGHGHVDKASGKYYLIPYDFQGLANLDTSAIEARLFADRIADIQAARTLIVLDCCHAEGFEVKALEEVPGLQFAPFPTEIIASKSLLVDEGESGSKAITDLMKGNGRAVLNSSTGAQSSYVRRDKKMSLFTYHLIEGLTGHATPPDDTVILVTDVMSWVTREVEKSAALEGRQQTPRMQTNGVFPVAQSIGGQGVDKGLAGIAPNPLEMLQIVIYGDVIFRRVELEAPLREVFDPLIEKHRATFGGRKKELAQIADFLRQGKGGYLAITANAGFGKTSLMAALAGERPNAFAYHFFTPLYGESSLSEAFFLRNIVQQMAAWYGEEGELPAEPDKLAALYHKYLDKELPEARVLLLDGLDEVTRWSLAPYLQRSLPDKLQVIVTIRDVGQDWRKEYGFPQSQLTHLPMDGLSMADIQDVLLAAGGAANALAAEEHVVAEIGRVAAYDAQNPQAGADPFYVALLAGDLASGALTPQELVQRPTGLDAYLDEWWQAIKAQAGDEATRDLFGTLAAALGRLSRADLEAVNSSLVDDWAGDYFDEVLHSARRFVIGDEALGYSLVHPRLRTYLRDPRRIKAVPQYVAKLRTYCLDWANHRSSYALRYCVDHLAADEQPDLLFDTVADPVFRETQQEVLGSSAVTLDDLQLALQMALAQDRPLPIIRLVAAFRDTIRGRPLTQQLLNMLNMGSLQEALALAGRYPPAADWPRILYLYLALETAVAGDAGHSKQIARQGLQLPAPHLRAISDAFVVALARLVAKQTGEEVEDVIGTLLPGRDAAALLAEHALAPPLSNTVRDDLIARIEPQLSQFEQMARDGESEAVISVMPMLEKEARSDWYHEDDMRELLFRLAADPLGWTTIERTLYTILPNPYREYRDIGLEVVMRAMLAVPITDPMAQAWSRSLWQEILLTTLDQEGVSFTFDLPVLLLNEAKRRGEAVDGGLQAYHDQVAGLFDKWGTRMRFYSAAAADQFYAGDAASADDTLAWVASEVHGYAGLATGHLMSVANRWLEFGRPERLEQPLTASVPSSLVKKVDKQVSNVRDAAFRKELSGLVRKYHVWRKEQHAPDTDAGVVELRRLQNDYARNVYVDYLSARWSWPPQAPHVEGLKALLPLVLDKGTLVDLILARLLRAYLTADPQAMDGAELLEAQIITNNSLATGRPWELVRGPWVG